MSPVPPVRPPAGATLVSLFEARARREPGRPAVVAGSRELTLGEVDRRSAALARRLRRLGVGPEVPVGIFLGRGEHLVPALLGVLRAGGAYVPLDPAYPEERIAYVARDAGLATVVSERALAGRLPSVPEALRPLLVDGGEEPDPNDETAEACAAGPGHLAYVIYTSGSTGRPKGVAIEHRSAVALLAWAERVFSPEERAGLLASTSICFDLSVFEIFAPLCLGGRVILAENALELPRLAAAGEVTLLNTVPSVAAQLLRLGPLPPGVRTVGLAGEPLPRSLADALYAQPAVRRVLNLYGPSEDTTYSTWVEVARGATEAPPIGEPVDGTEARVVREEGTPAEAAGETGELFLGGAGLARGYLGRPALSAERFVPGLALVAPAPGGRLYRTGDRVRRRTDGGLDFLGRLDHQVKIRGFRIELGEVEAALDSHPRVAAAVALAREDRPGDRRLVAYVVPAPGDALPVAALRAALGRTLPGYMVPQEVVFLEALPLTPNGKVDRRALPAPEAAGRAVDAEHAPPEGPVEEALAAIWREALGVERVGRDDHFLELGGHSLVATQVVARVRNVFGVELTQGAVFEQPTVAALARAVKAAGSGSGSGEGALEAATGGGETEASFSQERLWFLDQWSPGACHFNVPVLLALHGSLAPAALAAALAEVERRHHALRTVFGEYGGRPFQRVIPPAGVPLPVVDLGRLAPARREAESAAVALRIARLPFDLARGPVHRSALVRRAQQSHRLLLVLHHVVSDDGSVAVLVRELSALYRKAQGSESLSGALPPLPVQYADFARWQRSRLSGGHLAGLLGYWRERLEGAPAALDLPSDRPRPSAQSFRGARRSVQLPAALAASLRAFARGHGASHFMVVLAGLGALLARTTGETDLVVSAPVAGRTRSELEGLIGFFVNTLALRLDLSGKQSGNPAGGPSFAVAVARARATVLGALAHQELPFGRLVEELRPERDPARNPLAQVVLSYQGTGRPVRELAPGLELDVTELGNGTSKTDLTLFVGESEHAFTVTAEYATDLFDATTIHRFLGHLEVLLEGALAEPERALPSLALLGRGERHQLLVEANDTAVAFAGGPTASRAGLLAGATLSGAFAAQAAATPERIALAAGGLQWSYGALAGGAGEVARRLRELGVGPETRVALCLERSAGMVAGLLGILEAGGAFVALDPAYPAGRLAFMLRDSGARVLVTREGLLATVGPFDGAIVCLAPDGLPDGPPVPAAAGDLAPPAGPAGPAGRGAQLDHAAYVLYTSGSTGTPKGVVVSHRSIANRLAWMERILPLADGDRVLQKTPYSFDPSLWEIFLPLAAGARLELAAPDGHKDVAYLARAVAERRITRLQFVPAQLALFVEAPTPRTELASLAHLFCGGEGLPGELVERCLDALDATLWNFYGPVEAAVDVTAGRCSPGPLGATASLGRPLDNVAAYVLDRGLVPAPPGAPGELVVGGVQLARGYLDRPAATAAVFVPDPFAGRSARLGERLYRTGDLVRTLHDGRLEFLGRIDHQVKLRGQRIELGEIEAALAALPGVRAAAVAVRGEAAGRRLVAYVVPAAGPDPGPDPGSESVQPLDTAGLRAALARSLPEPMVPAVWVRLDELPSTSSGKVDRRALPEPAGGAVAAAGDVAPRTAVEASLATIWAELLRLPRVGVEDDFFALGGHSLLATQVLFRVRASLGVEISLPLLFERRTVAGLARAVEEERAAAAGGARPLAAGIGRAARSLARVHLDAAGEAVVARGGGGAGGEG